LISNAWGKITKILVQYRDPADGEQGWEAEERVNECERASRCAKVPGRSTPPIVQHGKAKG